MVRSFSYNVLNMSGAILSYHRSFLNDLGLGGNTCLIFLLDLKKSDSLYNLIGVS